MQTSARVRWLQVTPVLAEVNASLVLVVSEQRCVAEFSACVCLRPEGDRHSVGTLVVENTWLEGEPCLRPYLGNEFAICDMISTAPLLLSTTLVTYIGSHS